PRRAVSDEGGERTGLIGLKMGDDQVAQAGGIEHRAQRLPERVEAAQGAGAHQRGLVGGDEVLVEPDATLRIEEAKLMNPWRDLGRGIHVALPAGPAWGVFRARGSFMRVLAC